MMTEPRPRDDEHARDEERPFLFPQGMAGFPEARHFGFLYSGRGDIACMQSVDCPEAAFLVTVWDEDRLGPPPALTPEQAACLQLAEGETPLWMLVLNPFADAEWITANLRAPLAINMETRIGVQCVQPDASLELRHPWMPQPKEQAAAAG